jgi:hypothetical protein
MQGREGERGWEKRRKEERKEQIDGGKEGRK